MEKSELHILAEIGAGNIHAFEQLFFQYQPKLVCFLTGLTHDPELSRDMARAGDVLVYLAEPEKVVGSQVSFCLSVSDGPL